MEEIRLNKYLAECGVCSLREADKLIETIGPQNVATLGGDLKMRKAVDFIYENAVIKDAE